MSHTPGPWDFDGEIVWVNSPGEQERHTGNFDLYNSDIDTTIATVNGQIPEGRDNARLIAAAPEMLTLLQEMVAAFPDERGGMWDEARALTTRVMGRDGA